jgi:hypothetical protein
MPFTTYLRRVFRRGGFFGVPRPFFRAPKGWGYLDRADWPPVREVEAGIFLPDHPVFEALAKDMDAF